MTQIRNFPLGLALFFALSLRSAGANTAFADEVRWRGDTELGFVVTEGTSQIRSLTGLLDLTKDGKLWRNQVVLETLNVSDKEGTSAERYLVTIKTDYKFENEDFLFAELDYENDRFSGFVHQLTFVGGLGKLVYLSGNHQINAEFGPGFRRRDTLAHDREDVTITRFITAIQAQINGHLSLKVSLTAKHSSDVSGLSAGGDVIRKTNYESAFRLVYTFL